MAREREREGPRRVPRVSEEAWQWQDNTGKGEGGSKGGSEGVQGGAMAMARPGGTAGGEGEDSAEVPRGYRGQQDGVRGQEGAEGP